MQRAAKLTAIGIAATVALALVLVLDRIGAAHRSLDDMSGTLILPGLSAPADILRDKNAVPHIFAASETDAAFALGVAHAQDRLWQMELFRRVGQGRLAELFGAAALPFDRYVRTLGLYRLAEDTLVHLRPDTRGLLDAYARGVNAYLAARRRPLPPEFILLAHRPDPWHPRDSVVMVKLLALGLSGNATREISRALLSQQLSPDQIAAFMPPYPGDAPVALDDLAALYRRLPLTRIAAALPDTGPVGASNNWVVAGRHSATGKPLLANDPHLGMLAPSIWYLAHLAAPGHIQVGATIAGVPGIILGRNDHIAWGYTNTGADTQDLYIEKLNPDNESEYLTPDGYRPFETRDEVIGVRFGAAERLEVRHTRHGPVLPASFARAGDAAPPGHVLALAWPALAPGDTSLEAGLDLTRARTVAGFDAALGAYVSPMQNMVVADRTGAIGFVAPARVPVRRPDHDTKGLAPAPGWRARNDWIGTIPFDRLPRSIDPASGRIATANNKIVPDSYPYPITRQWDLPYRAQRIEELLSQPGRHTVRGFAAMQMDNGSAFNRRLLPLVLDTEPDDAIGAAALEKLRAWNGEMAGERAEPLIFMAWWRALTRAVYADELGDTFVRHWSDRPLFMAAVLSDRDGEARWCDNIGTEAAETCAGLLSASLAKALAELQAAHGPDIDRWRWADAHHVVNRHLPGALLPVANRFFAIRGPSSGGNHTLNRGQHVMSSAEPYANIHAAGYRAVYDLADLDRSLFMISTGQSGNPLSPDYDNFAPRWAEGDYLTIPTDRETLLADAPAILRLTPLSGAPAR